MTDKLIDPATLSGTELLLRQKYASDTLAVSSPQAAVGSSIKEALSVHKSVAEVARIELWELIDLLKLKKRARLLVEAANKAEKDE